MLALAQNVLAYAVPLLFVLTLVITIHELGHFLVARWLGVAVDRFSIGFGRALLRFKDRSGVEWRIGWIPLGGYVRFAGDSEASSSVPDPDDLARMRRDIVSREGVGAERRYFHFKPVWQRTLVVAAGPMANFLLSIVLFSSLLFAFGQVISTPRVDSVAKGGAAERAGFRAGDLITAVDGKPVDDFNTLATYVAIRPGQPMRFQIQRPTGRVELIAAPELRERPVPLTGGVTRAGVLGIIHDGTRDEVHRRRYGPLQAVGAGVDRCADVIGTTLTYLGRVLTGRTPANQLGGVIGIAAATHGAAEAGAAGAPNLPLMLLGSFVTLLSAAATISVGIGFINLLPIPVLDGGHLLFYAYEAVARRPVAARVQAAGYRVGLALLLGLMLFAAWNDIQQLRLLKFLGGLLS
jgi:regulator of sigma E protease